MIMNMGTLHISEAELARDPYAVLATVEEGVEVVVERDHRCGFRDMSISVPN